MTRTGGTIRVTMLLALWLGMGWAQQDSGTQENPPSSNRTPAPAYGVDNTPPAVSENPPISGLDLPSLEPRGISRSFLLPGAQVSEAVDSNVGDSTSNSAINGVTRVLGSLTLQKLWANYNAAVDYVGGGAFYTNRAVNAAQLHTLDTDQRILWRTGQLAIRDAFSYLPEGSFGYGSFGGVGAFGGLTGGIPGGIGGTSFFGPGQFLALGQQPRITNTTVIDVTQQFTPRSSAFVAGSFGLVHFTDENTDFIDSQQISGQAAYNYQLNRSNQVAVLYGYQNFHYPTAGSGNFETHLWHLLWGHRITGRMDLVVGGGPQLTEIHSFFFDNSRLSLSGRASLRYRFTSAYVSANYEHYNTSGSGFFAGASSDLLRFSYGKPLHRRWLMTVDTGYTHNNRILPNPAFAGSRTYHSLYAGASLHRDFGRNFSGFVSYQFNHLGFDTGFCDNTQGPCSRTSDRNVAIFGLNWHPRPIRLD